MIRPLAADDADACDAIIGGLPEWFGMDEGIAECAAAVRIQRGLVAEVDGAVVGFVTHRLHYPHAAELTWLAVSRGAQRQGHGRELVQALARDLTGAGVRHLTVRTLSDRSDDEHYARTRAFYGATGFVPLLDLPELWDAENPAMVFVRDLDSAS
ncbi:MAG: GNAT family N-acetyltransferase [Gaiellales bacterium]|jgi:ribosomal protein S18 acetylase RimI-like enzyme